MAKMRSAAKPPNKHAANLITRMQMLSIARCFSFPRGEYMALSPNHFFNSSAGGASVLRLFFLVFAATL
jgi:hypothetical protein